MATTQPIVYLLAGAAVAVGIWWILQNQNRHHRKEGFNGSKFDDFERICLTSSDKGNGRYWRSDANYVSEPWENPHYKANPHDPTLPLGMAKRAPGLQLIPPYKPHLTGGQYTPGCGDFIDEMPDDHPTRMSTYESGNMDYRRLLNATREDGVMGDFPTPLSVSLGLQASD